ncbi:hypothetical protein GQ42DRAFT_164613 [Ramicandelaber brevisporus]|nr:hypothetical protein GQ42DRAFT_164613 [Ramicandelaber brevisporus]
MIFQNDINDLWFQFFPPQRLVATRNTKTFYDDLHIERTATRDKVLDAAVIKFYEAFERSYEKSDNDPSRQELNLPLFHVRKLEAYAPFQTLYDPVTRTAYDVYGDGLFALLGIEADAKIAHPSVYGTPFPSFSLGYFGLATCLVALVLVVLNEFVFDKAAGVAANYVFGLLFPIALLAITHSYIPAFINNVGNAVALALNVNTAASAENQMSANSSKLTLQQQLQLRLLGIRLLLKSLRGIHLSVMGVIPLAFAVQDIYPEYAKYWESTVIASCAVVCLMEILGSVVLLIGLYFIPNKHLKPLYRAVIAKSNSLLSDNLGDDGDALKQLDRLSKDEIYAKHPTAKVVAVFTCVLLLVLLMQMPTLQQWMSGPDASFFQFVADSLQIGGHMYFGYIGSFLVTCLAISRTKQL